MDIKSILGYADDSPFRNNPYLDIDTPKGIITMENTSMDLLGIDNLGNAKKMKAGRKKPYKFEGNQVREIPIGNPYQMGGLTSLQLFNFLFDDDDEEKAPVKKNTAPTTEDVERVDTRRAQRAADDEVSHNLAMEIALGERMARANPHSSTKPRGNPYLTTDEFPTAKQTAGVNPYVIQTQNDILSKYNLSNLGVWGDAEHQTRKSDHNTGDAQDFAIKDPVQAEAAIAQLQKEAKERKVKYIVYNSRIWNPSISPDWRPYRGKNPHKSHFHVSYNR